MRNDDIIPKLLNQLEAALQQGQGDAAQHLSETAFNVLLKSAYAQVRGRASTAVMRNLLTLEIEIGGDNGDFREFDAGHMLDLLVRGDVIHHLQAPSGPRSMLSAALDLKKVAAWLADANEPDPSRRRPGLRFLHAWMRLFAEETGLIASEPDRPQQGSAFSVGVAAAVEKPHSAPQTVTDPVTGMRFVWVPAGSFSMGDTFGQGVEDETPVHEVSLSPFYMAVFPVTQQQWCRLMPNNPSAFVADDHPVEQVTLADVTTFLERLNAAVEGGQRFDLPSEAQWEYAARSGGRDELYAGGPDPESVAWFEADQIGRTAAVGGKAPNGLGLYDMSGNVWEWCRDLYHPQAYRQHAKVDPVCIRGEADRVIRGGSWHLDAWSARCSRRFRFDPQLYGPALGFRVVMRDS